MSGGSSLRLTIPSHFYTSSYRNSFALSRSGLCMSIRKPAVSEQQVLWDKFAHFGLPSVGEWNVLGYIKHDQSRWTFPAFGRYHSITPQSTSIHSINVDEPSMVRALSGSIWCRWSRSGGHSHWNWNIILKIFLCPRKLTMNGYYNLFKGEA